MAEYRWELFDRRTLWGRRWYFRFRAANGEVMAQSEAYNSRAARDDAVFSVRGGAAAAVIVEEGAK